jgi:hypothetical protein
MHTKQGLERLVFFSDAVAAIAITLIILPLVDSARNLGSASVASFLADNLDDLAAAALSFVVIAAFWRGHHALFDRVTGYTTAIALLQTVARRSGLLAGQGDAVAGRHWAVVALMAVGFLIALVVPGAGMKALFVLVLAYPLRVVWRRNQRARRG